MALTGYGIGFRPQHFADLTGQAGKKPDWLEALSENFMGTGGEPFRNLIRLRADFPVCLHGVSMSIAGQDSFPDHYQRDLKQLVSIVDPVFVSDHLCWTSLKGHNSHDLLPVPYSWSMLDHVCSRIQKMQDHLDRSILFENPSAYIAFAADEMTEAEFLAEMCRRTGCGLLLDVNNLFVNHKNLGLDPVVWLDRINPAAVGYIHMAGHTIGERLRVDTHDEHVCPEVWDLYAYVNSRFGRLPAMIEWDDNIPSYDILMTERENLAHHAGRMVSVEDLIRVMPPSEAARSTVAPADDWAEIQEEFFGSVTADAAASDRMFRHDTPAKPADGLDVYANAYIQRLTGVFRDAFPVLNKVIGRREFDRLVEAYLADNPPGHYTVKYASAGLHDFSGVAETAGRTGIESRLLMDLIALEWMVYDLRDTAGADGKLDRSSLSMIAPDQWSAVKFRFQPAVAGLPVRYRVDETLRDFQSGVDPAPPPSEPAHILVWRSDGRVYWQAINEFEQEIFRGIRDNLPFEECCANYQRKSGEDLEQVVFNAVELVGGWLDEGIISGISL
jgi:hypothetical protein